MSDVRAWVGGFEGRSWGFSNISNIPDKRGGGGVGIHEVLTVVVVTFEIAATFALPIEDDQNAEEQGSSENRIDEEGNIAKA